MKKFSMLALAIAGMLVAACSSESDVAKENSKSVYTDNEGYIGVAIQLPNATTPSLTRSNDAYNDGDATEYAVKSGKLFLFKGATEAGATFLMAKDIIDPTEGWNTDGSERVTSTKTAVAKIENITLTSSEKLYAYVALNYSGTELATNPSTTTTFEDWSKTTLAAAQTGGSLEGEIASTGLLMTNAPISATKGGTEASTGAVTTAVELDKTAIKNTKDEAAAAPAGCVYVERAAAKVTLEVTTSATEIDMKDNAGEDLKMSTDDIAWQIINTEENFYNARQANFPAWLPYMNDGATNANSKYRFVSYEQFSPTKPTTGDHTEGYRTYFAKDPTYDTDHDALQKPVAIDDADHWLAVYAEPEPEVKGKRAYVPENTFPTQYQTRKNTTQATVRVKFNEGHDFYTIKNDALYYTAENAKAKINSNIMADYNVAQKMTAAASNIATAKGESSVAGSLTIELTSTAAGDVTYTATPAFTGTGTATTAATYTIDDITNDALKSALTTAINNAMADNTLSLYKGGYAYYNVRIKHFGDVETPWSASGTYVTKPGTTTEQIYKLSATAWGDNAFLGRYGIVRDNWYKLSIDGITKLGSATPKDVTGDPTPDDEIEKEYYISAHVHILPWVLRTQSV
ncbi:MAG: fimbria major subunit, partial [Prevotella sp.]|nr:fimbria major subunit [Prevotella sp.]